MHDPVTDVLGVLQGWDHGEHPFLLRPFQVGLEAHHVVDGPLGVVLTQLDHGEGLLPRLGVLQAHRLQGAIAQRVSPPAGHDLHRHAALKHPGVLKAVDLRLLGGGELPPKGVILLLGQGAVDVVRGAPVIPGGEPGGVHVHALKGDQRGGGVEEIQVLAVRKQVPDGRRQPLRGQGAGGNDDIPFSGDLRHLPLHHGDPGVGADFFRDLPGEGVAVHRQGPAGLHPVGVGAGHNQGLAPAQLLLQQAHRVLQLVGPQGVRAHQLPEIFGVVGGGHLFRLHLPQLHRDSPPGQLPGGLAPRQAGADDDYFVHNTLSF